MSLASITYSWGFWGGWCGWHPPMHQDDRGRRQHDSCGDLPIRYSDHFAVDHVLALFAELGVSMGIWWCGRTRRRFSSTSSKRWELR